jgi:hypothetical protein
MIVISGSICIFFSRFHALLLVTYIALEKKGVVMALVAGVEARRFLMYLVTLVALQFALLCIVRVRGLGVYGVGLRGRRLGVHFVGVWLILLPSTV